MNNEPTDAGASTAGPVGEMEKVLIYPSYRACCQRCDKSFPNEREAFGYWIGIMLWFMGGPN